MSSIFTDQQYLRGSQYADASNLNARLQLHVRFSDNKYNWHRWVFDQFELPEQARVLEVGCGSAALWWENRERIPAGWEITLSDFSPGMIGEARRRLQEIDRTFRYAVFDIQAIPLPDGCLDAVIANHMLYHVPDLDTALAEIRRVLSPTGTLYAATNGREHLQELDALGARVGLSHLTAELDFTLENGADVLNRFFPDVALYTQPNALRITEVEPIIAYLRSLIVCSLTKEQLAELQQYLTAEIERHGAFCVKKSSGLFIATK